MHIQVFYLLLVTFDEFWGLVKSLMKYRDLQRDLQLLIMAPIHFASSILRHRCSTLTSVGMNMLLVNFTAS